MECPYCGAAGSLVWDESRGTVVCSGCATVVDSIYVSYGMTEHEPGLQRDRGRTAASGFGRLSDASIKYLEILEEIKDKPTLYVDGDSFGRYLALGKRVKVVRRRVSLPRDETLGRIVAVMAKYPRLCSRTDRAKYAIAAIAYALVTGGNADVLKLSRDLGLSKTHVRRLVRLVLGSRGFLSEVRRVARVLPAIPAGGSLAAAAPAVPAG